MALTDEQIDNIKKQLFTQIQNSELENKEKVLEYVKDLDSEGLESFMAQNNIPNPYANPSEDLQQPVQQPPACIFCSITKKQMPSFLIEEGDKNIAVLEINPLSKGHSLILPKQHIHADELPKSTLSLAQKISKRIKKKFKPEDIKIETSSLQGHAMVNIIPIYKENPLAKKKASENELKELQNLLQVKKRGPRAKKVITTSDKKEKIPKISFRIP